MNLNSDLINDITVHELVTKIGSCTIVMYTYYSNYMNYISKYYLIGTYTLWVTKKTQCSLKSNLRNAETHKSQNIFFCAFPKSLFVCYLLIY